jgi:pimeloyl-ACP methyl ester carboxylesterase
MTAATEARLQEEPVGVAPFGLAGTLSVPADAVGVVVFAHGSGSSRLSPRNRQVAATLNEAGLATLLFDLLTPPEAGDRDNVFDIPLLAERLEAGIDLVKSRHETAGLPIGLFGASTGAAAALISAERRDEDIAAVVSRGGRPDLAGERLALVRAPTLLIVGGADVQVLALNKAAQAKLAGPSALEVIPGATHLFEEPGALDEAARLAAEWFRKHALNAPKAPAGETTRRG